MGVITHDVGTATGEPPLLDIEVACCHEMKSSLAAKKTPETIVSDRKPSRSFIGLVWKNLRGNRTGIFR
jgi:hypothetical protein